MNTELRFVLAVVLVVGVLVLTNLLFPPARKPVPAAGADSVATAARGRAASASSGGMPALRADSAAPRTDEPEREVVVEAPLYRLAFSTRGARLVSAELPQFKSFTRAGPAQLVGDSAAGALGMRLQFGSDTLDLTDAPFIPSSDHVVVDGTPARLTFRHVDAGRSVEVTYTFEPNNYLVDVTGAVQGVERPLVITELGTGLPLNDQDRNAEARSLAYVGNHLQKGISTQPLSGVKQASVQEGPYLWAAFKSKFFVFALLRPRADSSRAIQFGGLLVRPVDTPKDAVARVDLAATESVDASGRFAYRVYFGPLEIPRLAALGDDFDEVNQYRPAFLRPVVRPLVGLITTVLDFLHAQLKLGYGWVLILFGLLMRVLLWPFNQNAMRAQMRNMAVQPLLKEIQTKYKDQPEKLQQEMMKLYKEHGFNPLAGCLPMLLPYPILISLYFVFQYAIGLRGVAFGWMPDLSAPDPIFVLPILLGVSMFLLQWIGMRAMPDPNPQMKMMMWMMPIMMMFIFYRLAAGLNLYYAVSNIATIPQQLWISKERQKAQAQPAIRKEVSARARRLGLCRLMDRIEVDTIAAISTGHGPAAVALVRVSGPAAVTVLDRVAPELGPLQPRRTRVASIRNPESGEVIDQALVVLHPGPGSYTGEDVVEISGHGGWLGPKLVLEACLCAGARSALPGEFTRRAYLNGRMDLVQVEAVGDLIEGRSAAARRAALHQLDRGLSRRVAELRESLVALEALLVHHLDFPEEDDPPVPIARIAADAERVGARLRALVGTAAEGELLREGALLVLAGRPNSGKSSLFNALLGVERAIVTDVPGTTRDALEASASLGGFPFRLVDTAGLRSTEDGVERLGVEVARRYLAAADVVVFCAEEGRTLGEDESDFIASSAARPVLLARTKADLRPTARVGDEDRRSEQVGALPHVPSVRVSAVTGEGLEVLRCTLSGLTYRELVSADPEAPVLTRARQARAARTALEEVDAFARELRDGVGPEVASARLGLAETALEEMLGVITSEDVLDRVFAEFCIGK